MFKCAKCAKFCKTASNGACLTPQNHPPLTLDIGPDHLSSYLSQGHILLSQHSAMISLSLFIINTSYLSERHIIVTTAKQYHFHFPSTHQHNTFHRGIFYCHSIAQRYHFLSTPLTSHRGIF